MHQGSAMSTSQTTVTDPRPVMTPEEAERLRKEGEELRKEIERRVAPMKRVSPEDLRLRLR